MMSKPQVAGLADPEHHNFEAYPLTMAVFRIFRAARKYRREILDKLALGSDTMLDLGNLYTERKLSRCLLQMAGEKQPPKSILQTPWNSPWT
jgi:hypothetical protein